MDSLSTLATYWFDFRQEQHFFLSQYIYKIEITLTICAVNYVIDKIFKCG